MATAFGTPVLGTAPQLLHRRRHCGPGPRLARDHRVILAQGGSNAGPGPGSSSDSLSEKLLRVRRRLGLPTDGSANGAMPADSGRAGAGAPGPAGGRSSAELGVGEWGTQSWYEDWDPSVRYSPNQVDRIADEGADRFRKLTQNTGPRDKWITPVSEAGPGVGAKQARVGAGGGEERGAQGRGGFGHGLPGRQVRARSCRAGNSWAPQPPRPQ